MPDSKELFRTRKFLNPNKGMAAIEAAVTINDYEDSSEADSISRIPSIDGLFSLTDCSRSVSLDFDVYVYNVHVLDKKGTRILRNDLKNSVQKARALRDAMIDFTEALEKAAQEVRDRIPAVQKAQRKAAAERAAKLCTEEEDKAA